VKSRSAVRSNIALSLCDNGLNHYPGIVSIRILPYKDDCYYAAGDGDSLALAPYEAQLEPLGLCLLRRGSGWGSEGDTVPCWQDRGGVVAQKVLGRLEGMAP
jgi:hypothetical protein